MTICAVLSRADAAGSMWEMRIKSLPTVAFGANRLLLRINPFPIGILGTNDYRTRRTDHRHTVFLYRSVNSEHEDIISNDLWVVGREISLRDSLELVYRDALICLHRQMTTKPACRPRGVTDLAVHLHIVVGQSRSLVFAGAFTSICFVAARTISPGFAIT